MGMKSKHMKYLTLLLVLVLGSPTLFGQITVNDYPMKVEIAVDQLDDLAPVTAASTCGKLTSMVEDQLFSGGCMGTLVRTYTFSDTCGEEVTAQQFISLTDDVAPVFQDGQEQLTAGEGGLEAAPEPFVTDNSGQEVRLSKVDQREGQLVIRMWTAEDPCGNTAILQQRIQLKEL